MFSEDATSARLDAEVEALERHLRQRRWQRTTGSLMRAAHGACLGMVLARVTDDWVAFGLILDAIAATAATIWLER